MVNGRQPHGLRHFDEERTVIEIYRLFRRSLRQIDGHAEDVGVRLAKMHEAGGDKEIDKIHQAELADAVFGQLAALITDYRQLDGVAGFGIPDQLDHFRIGLRLRVHESFEVILRKTSGFVEYDTVEVNVEAQFANLVRIEGQMMALVHFGEVQVKLLGGPPAAPAIPPVGQNNAANVGEYCLNSAFLDFALRSMSK